MLALGRLVLLALASALLAAGSLSLAGPASAEVTGSTSTGDVVLYQRCQQHPISYEIAVSSGTTYWHLEIQVFDQLGRTTEQRVLTSADSPTAGTVTWTFCGSELPGTYAVRASGFYQTVPGVRHNYALPETAFEVRPMATRTRLTDTRLGQGRYRLTALVRQQAERGFERAEGIPVRLERRGPTGWHRVRGLPLTTVDGRAATTVTRPGAYRAVVRPSGNHDASMSQVVTLGR